MLRFYHRLLRYVDARRYLKNKMEDGVYEQTKNQKKSSCVSAFDVDVNFIIPEHQLYTDCGRRGDGDNGRDGCGRRGDRGNCRDGCGRSTDDRGRNI